MISKFSLILPVALLLAAAPAQSATGTLAVEATKIDAWASDPDARIVLITAMANDLKVHRNHLILLRKETGRPYSEIYVSSLKEAGLPDGQILDRTRAVTREVERQLKGGTGSDEGGNSEQPRPVLSVATGVDHNAAGTFCSVTPEVGIDTAHASMVFAAPYYRASGGSAASGIGDAYATGSVYGRAGHLDVSGSLTIGLPTGDKNFGLGAGKITADISGTVAHRFERFRPFLSAGFANSSSSFAYFRPYISDGNAAHISGGADFQPAPRLTIGFGGFALLPAGQQTVYSRIASAGPADTSGGQTPSAGAPSNNMPGMGTGPQPARASGPAMSSHGLAHMPFLSAAQSTVAGSELADHGVSGWMSVALTRGVAMNVSVARSVPFQLTTLQAGMSFDIGRLLFQGPRKHEGHAGVPNVTAE